MPLIESRSKFTCVSTTEIDANTVTRLFDLRQMTSMFLPISHLEAPDQVKGLRRYRVG